MRRAQRADVMIDDIWLARGIDQVPHDADDGGDRHEGAEGGAAC
jgi:hypothetical protein